MDITLEENETIAIVNAIVNRGQESHDERVISRLKMIQELAEITPQLKELGYTNEQILSLAGRTL